MAPDKPYRLWSQGLLSFGKGPPKVGLSSWKWEHIGIAILAPPRWGWVPHVSCPKVNFRRPLPELFCKVRARLHLVDVQQRVLDALVITVKPHFDDARDHPLASHPESTDLHLIPDIESFIAEREPECGSETETALDTVSELVVDPIESPATENSLAWEQPVDDLQIVRVR